MVVASYWYYEKVRRTMHTAIVSYHLKYFYSFSAAELDNIGSEDEVFTQEFSLKERNYEEDDEDTEQLYIRQDK